MSIRFTTAICVFMLGISSADAHAMLDHSTPAVGSTVQKAPRQISLWFTEGVEPAFSGVTVRNGAGQTVSTGKAHLAPGGKTALQVPVGQLPPGIYKVEWHVLSVDTHKTQGAYSFTVGGH